MKIIKNLVNMFFILDNIKQKCAELLKNNQFACLNVSYLNFVPLINKHIHVCKKSAKKILSTSNSALQLFLQFLYKYSKIETILKLSFTNLHKIFSIQFRL